MTLLIARGRPYYLAPAYPMLLAAGAVWGERWLETVSPATAGTIRKVFGTSMVISGLATAALVLPLAPAGSRWWRIADSMNTNFNEEFGWREMTDAVVRVRDSLSQDDVPVGVLAGDAGEAAVINLYGRGQGLPEVISGSNSHWLRGYGNPPPKTVIAAGFLRADLETVFASCELAGHVTIPYGIENSAIGDRTDIFVCRHPREPASILDSISLVWVEPGGVLLLSLAAPESSTNPDRSLDDPRCWLEAAFCDVGDIWPSNALCFDLVNPSQVSRRLGS